MSQSKDFNKFFSNKIYPEYRLKKRTYITCPFSFDIEVTSTYSNGHKLAFPYIEMFAIDHKFFYTRHLQDAISFFDNLCDFLEKNDKYIICFVHNLAYEFMFLNKFMPFKEVFARKKFKVMKCLYRRIEFRCTYILSNMSLDLLAKRFCKTQKKKTDLDYSIIRYPETPLTREEMGYCRADVIILNEYFEYIYHEFIEGKKVVFFPLTSTSIVRHYTKSLIENENDYHKKLQKIAPSNYLFNLLQLAFMGGYVHGNVVNAFFEHSNVDSYDKKSSYPSTLFCEKFPMSKFKKLECANYQTYYKRKDEYAMLMRVRFKCIRAKANITYISSSKCIGHSSSWVLDNGRVWTACYIDMIITEKDMEVIQEFYTCKEFVVYELYVAKKNYLPKFILDAVVNIFSDKESIGKKRDKYKDIDEKKFDYYSKLYAKKKNEFNSLYGMMVTNNHKDSHVYKDGFWIEKKGHYEFKRNDFLVFQWGVWCTAISRFNLMHNLSLIGDDWIYSDTDSRKLINAEKHQALIDFENEEQRKKIKKVCDLYGYDYELLKELGSWEWEGQAQRFKHLGAKRYCFDEEPTCSGISKKAFADLSKKLNIPVFDIFKNGMEFDSENSQKNTSTYVECTEPYPYTYTYEGVEHTIMIGDFIHIEPASFVLKAGNIYETFKETLLDILANQNF